MNLKKLAREPLVHFLIIGAALFLIGRAVDDGTGPGTDRIVVTPGHIEQMVTIWSRTWQRPPTERELEGLIEEYVREEVFYREALALGLDRDDMIIRRRMRQKMEFLSEDIAETVEPAEEELQAFLVENAASYRVSPRLSFTQVYVSRDRRGADAERDAARLLTRLSAEQPVDASAFGDPSLLPRKLDSAFTGEIARTFGGEFADQLVQIEPGRWSGPVESGYGLHLVLVRERVEGRTPELDEVRDAVHRDWMSAKRREMNEGLYRRMRDRYTVVVQRPGSSVGSGRSADRKP